MEQAQKGLAHIGLILLVVALAAVGFTGWYVWRNQQAGKSHQNTAATSTASQPAAQNKEVNDFFTAVPVDLSQIYRISKFRSCAGHDYSGLDAKGIRETNRSMKNYLQPIAALAGSSGKIKVFAPFDGQIYSYDPDVMPETGTARGHQVILTTDRSSWQTIFFHTDLVAGLDKGSKVTAGQHLGYANITGASDFDISLRKFKTTEFSSMSESQFNQLRQAERQKLESQYGNNVFFDNFFDHSAQSVLNEFAKYGITRDNVIILSAVRDKSPCNFDNRSDNPDDWVVISH